MQRIGAGRVRPGPIKAAETNWITPTGRRKKKGDRPAKAGGFGALHRALLDVPKLEGRLASFAVTVRMRDARGRFVKIHEGRRRGMPDIRNARELRATVEERVRREVFTSSAQHRRKYPDRPAAGASAADFKRWKKRVSNWRVADGVQFKVEVFREVTGGTGRAEKAAKTGRKTRVRQRRR